MIITMTMILNKMVNTSGSAHSCTTEQLRSVLGPFTPTHNETSDAIGKSLTLNWEDFI